MESEKRQEEVVAERREAEKRRILAEDQLRAQTIGQEKRRLEVMRLERLRDEKEEFRRQKIEENKQLIEDQFRARIVAEEKRTSEALHLAILNSESENRGHLDLERLEKLLISERELRRRDAKQERARSIRAFCLQRGIRKLIHFTRLENLRSVLSRGLLGRYAVESLPSPDRPILNDAYRFDGVLEAVCLSISFPNYRMFNKLSNMNRRDWVVLVLEPYILWEFDCAFYERNAAASSTTSITLAQRREYSSLVQVFTDQHPNKREGLGIPVNYPTNPQAEVLVLEPIAPSYISEVHFIDQTDMENWLDQNGRNLSQRFVNSRDFFAPRVDYTEWKPRKNIPPLVLNEEDFAR